jgi:hypothetical protein
MVNKYSLIELYPKARLKAFKVSTIKAAFKSTGIWPFNQEALPSKPYLPAEAATIQMNLPGPASFLHFDTS